MFPLDPAWPEANKRVHAGKPAHSKPHGAKAGSGQLTAKDLFESQLQTFPDALKV